MSTEIRLDADDLEGTAGAYRECAETVVGALQAVRSKWRRTRLNPGDPRVRASGLEAEFTGIWRSVDRCLGQIELDRTDLLQRAGLTERDVADTSTAEAGPWDLVLGFLGSGGARSLTSVLKAGHGYYMAAADADLVANLAQWLGVPADSLGEYLAQNKLAALGDLADITAGEILKAVGDWEGDGASFLAQLSGESLVVGTKARQLMRGAGGGLSPLGVLGGAGNAAAAAAELETLREELLKYPPDYLEIMQSGFDYFAYGTAAFGSLGFAPASVVSLGLHTFSMGLKTTERLAEGFAASRVGRAFLLTASEGDAWGSGQDVWEGVKAGWSAIWSDG